MKNNDFLGGDRCIPVTPSDTIDNVVFAESAWVSAQFYRKGEQTVYLGIAYTAVIDTSGAVAPLTSPDWTRNYTPEAKVLPSLIWCEGAGTVKFTSYCGDVDTLTAVAGSLLGQGAVRVRRVWAAGTTATGIHAIAEG